jgi:hypothetical protein
MLDAVELGAVRHIEYRGYIQSLIYSHHLPCLVDTQIIHEYTDVLSIEFS